MKEIKLTIPEGCKAVTVKVDGEQVVTEFEPKDGKYEPKDGDIIAYKYNCSDTNNNYSNLNIGIFHKSCGCNSYGDRIHKDYVTIGGDTGKLMFGEETFVHDYMRPATEEEKQRLFDALAKEGKRWNAEKKCIESLPRWRANRGETYYSINCFAEVCEENETEVLSDNKQYNLGNYFKTREAAERVAGQIREIFKNSKAE